VKDTNLTLTEKQEKDLVEYALDRVEKLKEDNKIRMESDKLSWKTYLNNRDDRHDFDSIYANSNTPVPLTSLVVDHFLARAEDDITGTSPYFEFKPQGVSDTKMAEEFNRFFQWKIETKGRIRERLEESYLHIFLQRAAIFKSVYEERRSIWYDKERNALFDNASQEFVDLLDHGPVVEGQDGVIPEMNPETGEMEARLEADPSFTLVPGQHEFKKFPQGIPTEQIKYKGPRSVVVDTDRFLAPSSVEHLEYADFIAELYDKDARWCEDMFLNREWLTFADWEGGIKKDSNPRTDSEKNRDSRENRDYHKEKMPMVPIVECWITRDVLGTGFPQEFCVFVDVDQKKALYYEYTAKLTPDNQPPYTTVAIGKMKNRWWGPSLPEKIRVYQEYVDKQFNSESYRNELSANPIVGVNPQAVEDEPEDVELHAGKLFELKDQYSMDDFLSFSAMPNLDNKTQELIDFVFGMVQLWLGVSNMAQGDYQALSPANTATGVEATLNEASKIGRRWMRRIVRGFEEHLAKLIKVAIATMDEAEVYEYMEGEVTSFAEMTPEKVANLEMNCKVILSQDQGQRSIEKANLALQVQERFLEHPPEIRPFSRPMFKRILDALGYENTDELLPEAAPADPRSEAEMMKLMADAQGAGQGAQGEAPEAGDAISAQIQGMGNSNPQGQNQYQQGVQQ
jgi:hypothetical protein